MPEYPQSISPNRVVVIVALTLLLIISFLLIAYIRFHKPNPVELFQRSNNHHPPPNFQAPTRTRSRLSGIERQVIETLPFFRFSSLKGSTQGLECTVCLSQFEDTEILRLLPKCKHAFHMSCIDTWLENDTNLEIHVQMEPSHQRSSSSLSSRFNIGGRFWDVGRSKKEEPFLIDQDVDIYSNSTNWKHVHRLNHKIVISDVVTRSRWSDLNSSDLLSLNSEMRHDMSSTRFFPSNENFHASSSLPSIFNNNNNSLFASGEIDYVDRETLLGSGKNQIPINISSVSSEDENSFKIMNHAEKRSMSENSHTPRFIEMSKENKMREGVASNGNIGREERLTGIWLPIAQRTVQWFAGQERNSRELEHKRLASNV
ncbi:hypothetical protein RJT34_16735 [Clitoria ternatea]|uniref:RING-type domain-containing protein n=1 Tax=Clitoria ternatea TaxID=43366 RepID=A0AAN9J7Z6_CLITE